MMAAWAVLLVLAVASLSLSEGTLITDTGFPFEGCKQRMASKGFTAKLTAYRQWKGGSYMCYTVLAMDQDVCNVHNNYPRNNTRCCDTMVNKFKLWPAQNCGGALRSTSVQLLTDKKPIDVPVSLQEMDAGTVKYYTPKDKWNTINGSEWVLKVTNLEWGRKEADGAQICFELQDPCPNMRSFSRNGKEMEWLLYDIKVDNYECCFPGVSRAVYRPFGDLDPIWESSTRRNDVAAAAAAAAAAGVNGDGVIVG